MGRRLEGGRSIAFTELFTANPNAKINSYVFRLTHWLTDRVPIRWQNSPNPGEDKLLGQEATVHDRAAGWIQNTPGGAVLRKMRNKVGTNDLICPTSGRHVRNPGRQAETDSAPARTQLGLPKHAWRPAIVSNSGAATAGRFFYAWNRLRSSEAQVVCATHAPSSLHRPVRVDHARTAAKRITLG